MVTSTIGIRDDNPEENKFYIHPLLGYHNTYGHENNLKSERKRDVDLIAKYT
jgi:hypothetical protein